MKFVDLLRIAVECFLLFQTYGCCALAWSNRENRAECAGNMAAAAASLIAVFFVAG